MEMTGPEDTYGSMPLKLKWKYRATRWLCAERIAAFIPCKNGSIVTLFYLWPDGVRQVEEQKHLPKEEFYTVKGRTPKIIIVEKYEINRSRSH